MDDVEGQQLVAGLRRFGAEATGVEAKRAASKLPDSTKESVVAFSNSSAGGTVILGLDEADDFRPLGVADPGKLQADFASMCSEEIHPPIRPELSLVQVDGATLVVAEVPPLPKEQRPAYVKTRGMDRGSYIRVGESDRRLTSEEVQQLLAERGQPVFDREPVPDTSVENLDPEMLGRYVQRLRETQAHLFDKESDDTLLAMTNVTCRDRDGSVTLTLAGLLAMGRYPQQFFPQLNATLVVYPDAEGVTSAEGVRFLDNVRLDGPIPVMVREAMAGIRRNMSRRALVTGEGRRDIYDYPPEALREVVVNAMVHRDLSPGARGTQVQIEMYPDRITFKNPGGLFGSVDITQLGEAGTSSARNGTLLKMLEDVLIPGEDKAICENRGSGIRSVKAAMRAAGMTPPDFKDSVTAFTVTLPNHALFDQVTVEWLSQINQEGLKDSQATALAMMRRGQVFDNSTYRAATGNQDSHSARMELQDLVARELVVQTGTRGSTKYSLSEYATAVGTQGARARAVRPDRRRQITGLLAVHGALSKTDISNRLGISPKTVEHYLRQLKQEGVVEANDAGRGKKFTTYSLGNLGDEVPLF